MEKLRRNWASRHRLFIEDCAITIWKGVCGKTAPLAVATGRRLKTVEKKLYDKGVSFEITKPAKAFLCKQGFDPNYGARPLLRTVQKYVEDPLSEFLLNSTMNKGDTVKVDYKGEGDALSFGVSK